MSSDIAGEQGYVSRLYGRLDAMREQAAKRLAEALRQTGGTPQARSERESLVTMYTDQVARLSAVENGLCFGRLDFSKGLPRYIGRIGLADDGTPVVPEMEPLLVDWRAPAARPFYLATAANPDGVRRRRHIRTRERTVTGLDDEVLDLDEARGQAVEAITGEAALLAALTEGRTDRMRDIVETIQAEQDEVIRADPHGALVVQGGPGTGKTAVALHRAAYLLYHHRRELSTRAVLIVGPNPTFLRYISHVLPSLAETGVLLRTLGDLFPGVSARRGEPAEVAELKGRPVMVEVIAAAIRDRQRLPDEPVQINVDRDTLWLKPSTIAAARERTRRTGKPHNLARPAFAAEIVHALADQIAQRIGADPLGGENLLDEADLAEIRRELRREPEVLAVLDWLWPVLTPQQLVAGLFAAPARLAAVAEHLTEAERAMLHRAPQGGFSPADVPLLDEAAEQLGEDEQAATARAARNRQAEIEYAEGALEIARGSASIDVEDEKDPEILRVTDLLDASLLAQRQEEIERLTVAERAAADRRWAFGHIIVDEAQELSPMAWRLLMRRCPSRSMTIVGDVAQTGTLGGTASWAQVLEPYVDTRWRLAELTVSYRTPAQIMAVAAGLLATIDPTLSAPRAVRLGATEPWHRRVEPDALPDVLSTVVDEELGAVGAGRVGVIAPADRVDKLRAQLARSTRAPRAGGDFQAGQGLRNGGDVRAGGGFPARADSRVGGDSRADGGGAADLTERVVVLGVAQAKGLEFDSVLLVDPAGIIAGSPRGRNDLYVALTRATQRLGVLHEGELPVELSRLTTREVSPA